MNAILTGDPVFVRKVTNAALYTVGSGDDTISVVHLWGTPYAMGFAHGVLMNSTARSFVNGVWSYLELQVVCRMKLLVFF